MEFSDFREYMPGDDIRRIDWNAYGRLDRLYIKEYMEEKEAVISILLDTSASMLYGEKKKSELACMLAATFSYIGLNNMDRVVLYDMKDLQNGKMQPPFMAGGGNKALPRLADWLNQRTFSDTADISGAVMRLPVKGNGITIIISDLLQETFLVPEEDTLRKLLRFLEYRKQRAVLLHVLAQEELAVTLTGTRNLIDIEDNSTLRLTLDAKSILVYQKALADFLTSFRAECARAGAFYAVCSTQRDIYQLIFQDLKGLYDI